MNILTKCIRICLAICFLLMTTFTDHVHAQNTLILPQPGSIIKPSQSSNPVVIQGIKIHPENALKLDFIVNSGDTKLSDSELKNESERLIKYFLTALTIPENNLWVNLSPYEKDRMIPEALAQTEMGTDMLSQDYLLKQITASLIYPEDELGKKFWKKIYKQAYETYGTTNIPIDTFNKVWIMPQKAEIYVQGNKAFIVKSELKVMLEQDYLALMEDEDFEGKTENKLASEIVREIIIPELTKEINYGKNFAKLRQIYNSLVLAYWFKNNLKDFIINKIYSDKQKIKGIDVDDISNKIYDQYITAMDKGVCNYVRKEYDPYLQKNVKRRYFSGGLIGNFSAKNVEIIKPNSTKGRKSASSIIKKFKKATAITLVSIALTFSGSAIAQAYQNGQIDPIKSEQARNSSSQKSQIENILENILTSSEIIDFSQGPQNNATTKEWKYTITIGDKTVDVQANDFYTLEDEYISKKLTNRKNKYVHRSKTWNQYKYSKRKENASPSRMFSSGRYSIGADDYSIKIDGHRYSVSKKTFDKFSYDHISSNGFDVKFSNKYMKSQHNAQAYEDLTGIVSTEGSAEKETIRQMDNQDIMDQVTQNNPYAPIIAARKLIAEGSEKWKLELSEDFLDWMQKGGYEYFQNSIEQGDIESVKALDDVIFAACIALGPQGTFGRSAQLHMKLLRNLDLSIIIQKAQSGDPTALNALGDLEAWNPKAKKAIEDLEKNFHDSHDLYIKAAQQGNYNTIFNLLIFSYGTIGEGFRQDKSLKEKFEEMDYSLLEQKCNQGDPESIRTLDLLADTYYIEKAEKVFNDLDLESIIEQYKNNLSLIDWNLNVLSFGSENNEENQEILLNFADWLFSEVESGNIEAFDVLATNDSFISRLKIIDKFQNLNLDFYFENPIPKNIAILASMVFDHYSENEDGTLKVNEPALQKLVGLALTGNKQATNLLLENTNHLPVKKLERTIDNLGGIQQSTPKDLKLIYELAQHSILIPSRFSTEALKIILKNRKNPNQNHPTATFIIGRSDGPHFSKSKNHYSVEDAILDFDKRGYQVLYYEASGLKEFNWILENTIPTDYLNIAGHGGDSGSAVILGDSFNNNTFDLKTGDLGYLDGADGVDLSELLPSFGVPKENKKEKKFPLEL